MSVTETSSSLEQENYIKVVVNVTPLSAQRQTWNMSDSSLSINSLLLAAEDNTMTPEAARRSNPFNKAIGTIG